ncbi:hypothetical protein QL285_009689 [Trifolium repens]|nr:hypothetical protein QL285_009689 [Trifolium repens]
MSKLYYIVDYKFVQHIPSRIVKLAIKDRTNIYVRSRDRLLAYWGTIKKPAERVHVRYLTDGCYTYLVDHKPRVGDKLNFMVTNPPDNLVVKLIRHQNRKARRR